MVSGFTGTIDNQLLKSRILVRFSTFPIKIQPNAVYSSPPIPHASLALSDSNKNRYADLIQCPGSRDVTYVIPIPDCIQLGKLFTLLKVLGEWPTEPVNIFFSVGHYAGWSFLESKNH